MSTKKPSNAARSRKAFDNIVEDPALQGKWLPVECLVELGINRYHIEGLDIKTFNLSVTNHWAYKGKIDKIDGNDTGVFRNPRRVVCDDGVERTRQFYYILTEDERNRANPKDRRPYFSERTNDWQTHYNNNRRKFSKRKRSADTGVVTPGSSNKKPENSSGSGISSGNNSETQWQQSTKALQQLLEEIGGYMDSTEARNLFNPRDDESVVATLHRRIELLDSMISNTEILIKYLNKATEYEPKPAEMQRAVQRCQYLRRAYEVALSEMPEKTWIECCLQAINDLIPAGITYINNPRAIQKWNQYFRKNEIFMHPNKCVENGHKYEPKFFRSCPEARGKVVARCRDNLEKLSTEFLIHEIEHVIIPELYEEFVEDCNEMKMPVPCDQEEFRDCLGLAKPVPRNTVWRWMIYLGYKYEPTSSSYYTDGHEKPDNVKDRRQFIRKYLLYERLCYVWVQISKEDAEKLEKDEKDPLMKDTYYQCPDGRREYHVDCHPKLREFVSEANMQYGGDLSVRKRDDERPIIMVGQDESVFAQYSFKSMEWVGPGGEKVLRPKGSGDNLMISAFQTLVFGLGRKLTQEELNTINERRRSVQYKHYKSKEAAMDINRTTVKPEITDSSPFLRVFELGADKEGYWNYAHMALQLEDLVDCLVILYPHVDFVFLFDQSSGHGKGRKYGLNAKQMRKNWGGKQPIQRPSEVTAVGNEPGMLSVNDIQLKYFDDEHPGPIFNKNGNLWTAEERDEMKYGEVDTRPKTKGKIITELKAKGIQFKKRFTAVEIEAMAQKEGIALHEEYRTGWLGQPKGFAQCLWERGYINLDDWKNGMYSVDGKKDHFDDDGDLRDEHKKYSLRWLMGQCPDFANEQSAMEVLLEELSEDENFQLILLVTPKYHCELAGLGIEYSWGLTKKWYRHLFLLEKRGKDAFRKSVEKCLDKVSIDQARMFAAKARRYMLTYTLYDENPDQVQNHAEIEKYVKTEIKCHRSSGDQEYGYIAKVWKEAMKEEQ